MWLLAILAAAGAQGPVPAAVPVAINGTQVAESELLWHDEASGAWWLPEDAAVRWRLVLAGRRRTRLGEVDVVEACVEPSRERCTRNGDSLHLEVDDATVHPLRVAQATPLRTTSPTIGAVPGAFVNYDVAVTRTDSWSTHVMLEGHAFRGAMSAEVRVAASAGTDGAQVPAFGWQVRLDQPQHARAWSLGSHRVDRAGNGEVAMVGLHVGRDFSLQPETVYIDRPGVLLTTTQPVHAQAYVDGLPQGSADVDYGTYLVEVGTAVPGRGELQVVTSDRDGGRRVTRLPYYYAPRLLGAGTVDWSVDIGLRSRDPLRADLDGEPAMNLEWARGVRRGTTVRAGAWLEPGTRTATVRAEQVVSTLGVATIEVTGGRTGSDPIASVAFGHEYVDRRFAVSAFAQLPLEGCRHSPGASHVAGLVASGCKRLRFAASARLSDRWGVHATMQRIDTADRGLRFAGAGIRYDSRRFTGSIGVQRIGTGTTSLSATLAIPLGRHWGQTSVSTHAERRVATVGVSGPLTSQHPHATYHADAYAGAERGIAAGAQIRVGQTEMRVEAISTDHRRNAALGASGALGWFAGRGFATRRIENSFVLVDAGVSGVPVTLDRRPVGRTGRDGTLVVPDARAYESNLIGLDLAALPIDSGLDADERVVAPPRRGGAAAIFHATSAPRQLTLRDENGVPVPAGAEILSGEHVLTVVGHDGRAYIVNHPMHSILRIAWADRTCTVHLANASPDGLLLCDSKTL